LDTPLVCVVVSEIDLGGDDRDCWVPWKVSAYDFVLKLTHFTAPEVFAKRKAPLEAAVAKSSALGSSLRRWMGVSRSVTTEHATMMQFAGLLLGEGEFSRAAAVIGRVYAELTNSDPRLETIATLLSVADILARGGLDHMHILAPVFQSRSQLFPVACVVALIHGASIGPASRSLLAFTIKMYPDARSVAAGLLRACLGGPLRFYLASKEFNDAGLDVMSMLCLRRSLELVAKRGGFRDLETLLRLQIGESVEYALKLPVLEFSKDVLRDASEVGFVSVEVESVRADGLRASQWARVWHRLVPGPRVDEALPLGALCEVRVRMIVRATEPLVLTDLRLLVSDAEEVHGELAGTLATFRFRVVGVVEFSELHFVLAEAKLSVRLRLPVRIPPMPEVREEIPFLGPSCVPFGQRTPLHFDTNVPLLASIPEIELVPVPTGCFREDVDLAVFAIVGDNIARGRVPIRVVEPATVMGVEGMCVLLSLAPEAARVDGAASSLEGGVLTLGTLIASAPTPGFAELDREVDGARWTERIFVGRSFVNVERCDPRGIDFTVALLGTGRCTVRLQGAAIVGKRTWVLEGPGEFRLQTAFTEALSRHLKLTMVFAAVTQVFRVAVEPPS
jgi:hypothetical protein